ncbi:MAG: sensor domain-containing diguanylate cyclase [Acidimicrobiia bacterium]|nr:sensor domain-containing diguanylate cyclase [Acidimicrobiia bacterium]
MLRQSGGGSLSGYAPLLLLPIIWQALYARTVDLALTIAAVALTMVLPIVLIGGTEYPVAGWRAGTLSTLVYSVTAITVQRLIRRVRSHETMLTSVVALTQRLTDTDDVRDTLCHGTRRIGRADIVVLSEVDATGRLRITASTDTEAARPGGDGPSSWNLVLAGGAPLFVEHTDHDAAPFRSVLHQPIMRGETPFGLVTLGWSEPRRRPPADTRHAVLLLASEAAGTIERKDLLERVTRLSRHDELTGLANRRRWDDHLAMELSRADRTGSPLVVALLDLDHFKWFNDEHGHLAGDRLLKEASAAWSAQLRPTDLLARWGGEEFALALPNTDLEGGAMVLERLRASTPQGQTFSAGLADAAGRDAITVMQSADSALYLAKESGRDRVVVFDRSDHEVSLTAARR